LQELRLSNKNPKLNNTIKKSTLIALIISMVATLVIISGATFAWFTANQKVYTNTVSGKSGSASLKFLIGPDEGSLTDSSESEVEIAQINEMDKEKMFPVTTADLKTFLYCPGFSNGHAETFVKDESEKYYFHGRVYLKLEGENIPDTTKYRIYLDKAEDAGGSFGENINNGTMLNGARLGLSYEDSETPIIFRFDEDTKGKTEINTYYNGAPIEQGQVLNDSGVPVSDPSVEFSQYTVDSSEENMEIPEEPLFEMEINKATALDVYFYLEGCDEDCLSELSLNAIDLHLAFYALATSE